MKNSKKTNRNNSSNKTAAAPKACLYCTTGAIPSYTDTLTLRHFTSSRSKIVGKARSGACARHQRKITQEIKRARHLGLLAFTAGV